MGHDERDALLTERMLEDIDTIRKRIAYFELNECSFCDDMSFEGAIAYDAVMNPLYRVVEDATHLSDTFTARNPSYPWGELAGFRNFVAHGYGSINRNIAWNVIDRDLPLLEGILRSSMEDDIKPSI